MEDHDIIGYSVKGPIFCALCGVRRDGGGFAIRKPIAGAYCSAQHARIAVDEYLKRNGEIKSPDFGASIGEKIKVGDTDAS